MRRCRCEDDGGGVKDIAGRRRCSCYRLAEAGVLTDGQTFCRSQTGKTIADSLDGHAVGATARGKPARHAYVTRRGGVEKRGAWELSMGRWRGSGAAAQSRSYPCPEAPACLRLARTLDLPPAFARVAGPIVPFFWPFRPPFTFLSDGVLLCFVLCIFPFAARSDAQVRGPA
ncbi:uncharacterized protein B0H18DRAFT_202855 [Fomitopsis serialis]|uniref:uncharacterized protein n=1 Tax=Fomitopsis serialis TaxID=139415 RepID=UPI002008C921|nr:uncharacterized protein B0H18DRAFT_202855 [Neoantrodia serialis]KAH9937604.1 hypothetical protein B0H18DRAFT_202855 [Neoantrodia serialis]